MMNKDEKLVGAIIGAAVGDALGRTVEGGKPGSIRNAYKRVDDYVDPQELLGVEKLYKWRKPGVYGAGFQQTLVLIDSVLQDRGFNPAKAAERFVKLAKCAEFEFGVYRGAGRNFQLSITDLRQGREWTESGRDTSGNGAAKRVAPLAVHYRANQSLMAEKTAEASLLTHRNPVGISAAIAVAHLIVRLLDVEEIGPGDPRELIADAAAFCREGENITADKYGICLDEGFEKTLHLMSGTLVGLGAVASDPREKVLDWIVKNAAPHASNAVTRPSLGFALASVPFAVFTALSPAESFESALCAAINEGGDSAAVGSMVGAMCGALHGVSAIPEKWQKGLANRKQIKAHAESLASGRRGDTSMDALFEMEYGLTKREHEERTAKMRKYGVEFPEKSDRERLSKPKPVEEKFDRKKHSRGLKGRKLWQVMAEDMSGDD